MEDLDLLLGLEDLSEKPEDTSEVTKATNNINLLSEEYNSTEPNSGIRTEAVILQEYTDLAENSLSVEAQIEEFKAKHLEIFEEYQAMLDKLAENSNKQSELKTELTEAMTNSGLKNISNQVYKVTYVAATTRTNFDRKSFEKKYPVLCKEFCTTSDISAYVKITEVKK